MIYNIFHRSLNLGIFYQVRSWHVKYLTQHFVIAPCKLLFCSFFSVRNSHDKAWEDIIPFEYSCIPPGWNDTGRQRWQCYSYLCGWGKYLYFVIKLALDRSTRAWCVANSIKSHLGYQEVTIEATSVACEQHTHFWSSLLPLRKGGREVTTGNASAVRRLLPLLCDRILS